MLARIVVRPSGAGPPFVWRSMVSRVLALAVVVALLVADGLGASCLWTRGSLFLLMGPDGRWQGRSGPLLPFDRVRLLGEDRPAGLEKLEFSFRRGKDWGPWRALEDGGEVMLSSEGPATALQLRLAMARVAGGYAPELILLFGRGDVRLSASSSDDPAPGARSARRFVSRREWGARPPRDPYDLHVPERLTIHHTWRPNRAQYRETATMRGIQRYHMDSPWTGWSDMGYHFLIGPDGWIYAGRPAHVIGAHCVPNTGKIGISLVGDYDPGQDALSPEAWASLVALSRDLCLRWDLPAEDIDGHRDYASKSCPGETVYERLPELRRAVEEFFEGPLRQRRDLR